MASLNYFYDAQLRRQILHFGRLFSWVQISTGKDENGDDILQRVPCRFASSDRMTNHIIHGNSENVMSAVPFLSYYINNMDIARDRTRNAYDVDDLIIAERQFNEEQQAYANGNSPGNTFHVQRLNPVPLNLEFNLDLWTSMLDHKLQIIEQIRMIYNPGMTLQSDVNPVNWIAFQDVELTNINYSSKSMPVGTDDAMDITTFTFKVESWLSPPAKVQKMNLIENIITNIGEGSDEEDIFGWSLADINRSVFAPGNYYLNVSADYTELTLLDPWGKETTTTWEDLFNNYGQYEEGTTQIRIRAMVEDVEDNTADIIGTTVIDPTDATKLTWTIDTDTLPSTTLDAVDGVINPQTTYPGQNLAAAATGQRYLLTQDIGSSGASTVAWGTTVAKAEDIIEYDGANWNVDFENATNTADQIVATLAGNKRYQWDEYNGWVDPIAGTWKSGWWRISINT